VLAPCATAEVWLPSEFEATMILAAVLVVSRLRSDVLVAQAVGVPAFNAWRVFVPYVSPEVLLSAGHVNA
jgi:hypothetical protein